MTFHLQAQRSFWTASKYWYTHLNFETKDSLILDCPTHLTDFGAVFFKGTRFNALFWAAMFGHNIRILKAAYQKAPNKLQQVRKITQHGQSFWKWTTQDRKPWREDMKEACIACTIFAVTGMSTIKLVRPALKYTIGLEGSFYEGPNSYRITSILLVSPIYACLLFVIGTISGRHVFFAGMSQKLLGRFFPKSLLMKATPCVTGKSNFQSKATK